MLTIIAVTIAILAWFKFQAPILKIVTQALGMVGKTMDVGEAHLDGWAKDAKLSADINSEKKRKLLAEELKQVNSDREAAGKAPLEMPE